MNRIFYYLTYFLPDSLFLRLKYFIKTKKILHLSNPKTYNEKLQWLKLNYRNPLYTSMVDKCEVKKIVSDKIGAEYVVKTLGIYDKFADINFGELPNQFVIKTTHDSGGVVICKDKNTFDITEAEKKITKSLKNNYYKLHREWPYKNVERKIIVEEYLSTIDSNSLNDYKFFCFNGKVKFLFVAIDRPIATKFNFYDVDFNLLNLKQHYPNFDTKLQKPKNFDKMIKLCEILSKDIPHVRIDLYNCDGKIYFGEMTFFHFSGFEVFEPNNYDYFYGNLLELPNKYED